MSSLPTVNWDFPPVFVTVPQGAVIGVASAIALYSFFQGMRGKGSDNTSTGILFSLLAFVAYKYMDHGLELRYYSMLFVVVFLGGYALLKWQIERGGGSGDDAGDFIVYGVLGVLIGARLGHVIFYDWRKALEDPAWIFKIWTGGLASHGAVMGLIVAMWVFTRRRGIPFVEGADRFAFSAALGSALVRLGNLFNSEIVGRVVPDQSWGFRFMRYSEDVFKYAKHGDPSAVPDMALIPLRYPTQLAEFALGLTVLGALWLFDRQLGREERPRGALISMFFLLYFIGRFTVEFYKEYEGNGGMPLGLPITMGQVLSIPGILIGIGGLWLSFKKRIPAGWPTLELPEEEALVERAKKRKKRKKKRQEQPAEEEAAGTGTTAAGEASRAEAERDESAQLERKERGSREDDEPQADDDEQVDDDEQADDDESDEDSDEEDDEDSEDEDEDSEDEEEDEDSADDDEDQDSEDEEESGEGETERERAAAPRGVSVDPDVADEFDAKGALKRRRD